MGQVSYVPTAGYQNPGYGAPYGQELPFRSRAPSGQQWRGGAPPGLYVNAQGIPLFAQQQMPEYGFQPYPGPRPHSRPFPPPLSRPPALSRDSESELGGALPSPEFQTGHPPEGSRPFKPACVKWWLLIVALGLGAVVSCRLYRDYGSAVQWPRLAWPEMPHVPEVAAGGAEQAPATAQATVITTAPSVYGPAVPVLTTPPPAAGPPAARCLGSVNLNGHGPMQIIAAGSNTPGDSGPQVQAQVSGQSVTALMSGRAYMGEACSGNEYSPGEYAAINFLGGSLSYTVDLAAADCGCIAALYLVDMHSNTMPGTCGGDYYCDANKVCGVNCDEVDIQEANKHMFKTTDHTAHDGAGKVGKPIKDDKSQKYGPGASCIDTLAPFKVTATFSGNGDVHTVLTQNGCTMPTGVKNYPGLAGALAHMTPAISYWSATDLDWFDGKVCKKEDPKQCGAAVTFSDFYFSPR